MSADTTIPSIPDSGPGPHGQRKKIPRPSNSFMIYRREQATQHTGLIAAELSTKLAKAWRNETPETRAHYARLAEQAKTEHSLKYPTYKFTPARRGTGKRAKAIAATIGPSRSARPKSHLESSTFYIPSAGYPSEQTTVLSHGPAYTPLKYQTSPNLFTTTKNNESTPLSTPCSYPTSFLASSSLFFPTNCLSHDPQHGPLKHVVRAPISTLRSVPYSYSYASPSLPFSYAPAQPFSSLQHSPLAPSPPQAHQAPQPPAQSRPSPLKTVGHKIHPGPATRPPPLNTDPQHLSNLDLLNIVLPMSQNEQYVTQWISQASTELPTSLPLDLGLDDQHTMLVSTLGHFLPDASWKVPPSVTSSSAIPYNLAVGDAPTMAPPLVYPPHVQGQNYSTSSVSSLESDMGAPLDFPLSSYPASVPVETATCEKKDDMSTTSDPIMSSPFMHPLLISQDMVVSPVLSTCSSSSPSLSNSRYDPDTLFKS